MIDNQPPINNQPQSRGFFATIPGILASLAAVLTAATGLYLGMHGKVGSQEDHNDRQVAINLTMSGQSAPTDSTAVEESDLKLSDASTEVSDADSAAQELVSNCAAGDGQACIDLLDALAEECHQGYGLSCDALFTISPEESDYENYGATCGGRFDDYSMAGTCEEL